MTSDRRPKLLRMGLVLVVLLLALAACNLDDDRDAESEPTLAASITPPQTNTPIPSFTPFPSATPTQRVALIPTATQLVLGPTAIFVPPQLPTWTPLPSAPSATPYPYDVRISYPVDGSLIAGYVTVVGSASHPRFVQYALEWGPDPNPGNLWYPITSPIRNTVLNSGLGAWNTTAVPDGNYRIRLHVWLNDGTDVDYIISPVRVSNTRPTAQPTLTPSPRPNQQPRITLIPAQQLQAGQSLRLPVEASDPDGDALNLFVASSNTSVVTAEVTGTAEIRVVGVTAGAATVTVTANDNRGGTGTTAFLVTVQGQNRAPSISPVPNQTLTIGESKDIPLTIGDPDNDRLTVNVTSDNPGMVAAVLLNNQAVRITGQAEGTASVTITANDGKGGTGSTIFQVSVAGPTNQTPSLSPIQPQTVTVGTPLDIPYQASDPDGDSLAATVISNNESIVTGQVLQQGVLRLTGVAAGDAVVTLRVDDGNNAPVEQTFPVTVIAANTPPTIVPIADANLTAGDVLDVPYTANDPNGDDLTAVAASSDDGIVSASVIASGTMRLTANGAGTAQITLTVGDGVNDTVSVSFNVTVGAANRQPQLGSADSQTVSAGANIVVSLSASDPDGDPLTFTAVSDNPAVATASAAPSAAGVDVTITGVMAGSATIRVDAEDGRGGVATTSFAVSVTSANQPPVIEQVPAQTLMVGEEISLTLTISDGNGDLIVLTAIAQEQAVATAEAVGSDTVVLRGVAEGTTTVDLTADDNQGGVVMSSFQVTVVPGETAFDLMAYPVVPEIPQEMAASLNLVYQGGLSLGNRPNAFSKVGDEAVASQNFLVPFATGLYDLGNYGALQSVLDAYSATTVREGDTPANSLTVESLAAGAQFSIDTLFTAAPGGSACDALGGGTNLACEFQLTRPSIALISFSAPNVVFMPAEQFRSELQTLVREAQSTYGVIPVLATIPAGGGYTTEQLAEYNRAIVEVAQASGVPLWNLWRAMQERGIGDPTGVAPEGPANLTDAALSYGVNVRNLTALQTLQAVRQAVGIQ